MRASIHTANTGYGRHRKVQSSLIIPATTLAAMTLALLVLRGCGADDDDDEAMTGAAATTYVDDDDCAAPCCIELLETVALDLLNLYP